MPKELCEQFVEHFKEAKHGMIQVSVADTGIGITKDAQKKLLKLFGFLDSSKELNTKGIGLGLHISKEIVLQFGGQIVCQSDPQMAKGTTF